MARDAQDLARALADRAEHVCRCYLKSGTRQGNYWQVGDVRNTPGRSMYVRLHDGAKGLAGKWTDAATGEHGDLLDVIRETCGLTAFKDVAEEARRFLSLPPPEPQSNVRSRRKPKPSSGSTGAARRLFAMGRSIQETLAESYLRNRGITGLEGASALRFHPRCYYRPDENVPTEVWPAMLAAVTDLGGKLTGLHRTWLDPADFSKEALGKAPIKTPRRAMGDLLGNAVRFGEAGPVMAAGEGIETVLSLRSILPSMPMMAALSAAHLAAIHFPGSLRRLYIARDADPAGDSAVAALTKRAKLADIEVIVLSPVLGDFNEDLRELGADALRATIRGQFMTQDTENFVASAT